MPDRETTIIPLAAADQILTAFRIGPNDQAYRRWKQVDGFRWVDFEDVLHQSPFVLAVDWTEWLRDGVELMIDQLHLLDIQAEADWENGGEEGQIREAGKERAIKYDPNDDDDFDDVVREINLLIGPSAQYRKLRSSEGSDGWAYALLPADAWGDLERSVPKWSSFLFAKLPSQLSQKVR
jgi:hypothetical protein